MMDSRLTPDLAKLTSTRDGEEDGHEGAPVSLPVIRERLRALEPRAIPGQRVMRHAAVAVIVSPAPAGPRLLYIQRAEHAGDPWSGHVAFPGGRHDPDDPDVAYTARRETREEIGLDLEAHTRPIGQLSQVLARARGRTLPLVVTPFVFELRGPAVPRMTLNHEVHSTLWIPIPYLLDPGNRQTMDYSLAGVGMKLPCYEYEGRTLWGLTLRMTDELLKLL